MSKSESFIKALLEIQKEFPVLKQANETKVQVSVKQIIQIAQRFHDKGFKEDVFSSFFR